jgi:hypothetical protein
MLTYTSIAALGLLLSLNQISFKTTIRNFTSLSSTFPTLQLYAATATPTDVPSIHRGSGR